MDATVTVTAVEEVGPDTYAIRFSTPEGFAAEPGQFVKLGTELDGESVARFYTLSSPSTTGTFEVTVGIDLEEGGEFSQFLADLEPGTEMDLSGPYGDDHYAGEERAVVLAGGPGIGAAVAIAEAAIESGNEAALVYRDDEPAHEARIGALRENGVVVHLLAGNADLTEPVADVLTGATGEAAFVYGFADFVADAEAAIEAAGGDADAAKVENFG
ncbi:ferredoxin--NADP reductase [Halorubrum gandharaense]